MTVKDMIQKLKGYNQNAQVYLSSDEEGNTFSTVESESFAAYGEFGQSVVIYPFEEYVTVPGMDSEE